MITKSKQDWTKGQVVRVGFLSLTVKAAVTTPGDYKPDAYILANAAGTQLYSFVPHNGLNKISAQEARDMLAQAEQHAARIAAKAIAQAQAARAVDALFA